MLDDWFTDRVDSRFVHNDLMVRPITLRQDLGQDAAPVPRALLLVKPKLTNHGDLPQDQGAGGVKFAPPDEKVRSLKALAAVFTGV